MHSVKLNGHKKKNVGKALLVTHSTLLKKTCHNSGYYERYLININHT